MIGAFLVVLLIVLLIGSLPTWPHSANWGPAPGGFFTFALIIVVVLWAAGRL